MPNDLVIRTYRLSDQSSWLRCRLLGFFDTDYYDDVWPTRPTYHDPSIQLVAVSGSDVIGILDCEIVDELATIATIVVHPDARGRGIATALFDRTLAGLPDHVRAIDAWTREDSAANTWYRRNGFVEDQRYLHIHKDFDDPAEGFSTPDGLSGPLRAFLHGRIEDEAQLRSRYRRVYVCRRYLRRFD